MNITHLKYAVEVEKTGSITQAAENLYMSQPNLSKAIKEFESSLGFSVFRRTSKGIEPTKKGQDFLNYAKNVLKQIDEMEAIYIKDVRNELRFWISVPRASYISHAFSLFVRDLDASKPLDINFFETNSMNAINNIVSGDYSLGIVRCQVEHEKYYGTIFAEKNLASERVLEYEYLALMSRENPLANRPDLTYNDLEGQVEIIHGDLSVPYLPLSNASLAGTGEKTKRQIRIYERGSQFDLLRLVQNTYMWVSPMPQELLDCYGLVQRHCKVADNKYVDTLIYPKGYHFSETEEKFLSELRKTISEIQ